MSVASVCSSSSDGDGLLGPPEVDALVDNVFRAGAETGPDGDVDIA